MNPGLRRLPPLLLLGAVLAAGSCRLLIRPQAPPEPPPVDPHPGRIARIEADLQPSFLIEGELRAHASLTERMADDGVPGVGLAFFSDGEIAWVRSYGWSDVDHRRPVSDRTLFQAGSISKPVAATVALALVQEGRLSLEEEVNEYLRTWRIPHHRFSTSVNLRRLLAHTAGTNGHELSGYEPGEPLPNTAGLLKGKGHGVPIRVLAEPGKRWEESDGGYTIVQLLLEDATGVPFPTLARERVLEPLGMTSSTFEQPLPSWRRAEAATGYTSDGQPLDGRFRTYPAQAARGLWTTPSNLARWALALQRARCGDAHPVLGPDLVHRMLTPDVGPYGLGPRIYEDGRYFGHRGSNVGFRARVVAQMDGDQGLVVMTNSDAGEGLIEEIVLTVAREYEWEGIEPTTKRVVQLTRQQLTRLAGTYLSVDAPGPLVIEALHDRLLVRLTWSGRTAELRPESPRKFIDPENGREVTFEIVGGQALGFETSGTRFYRDDLWYDDSSRTAPSPKGGQGQGQE